MDIPFSVRVAKTRAGGLRIRYGIAPWYRVAMACVFASVSIAIIAAGGTGLAGYAALAISALAAAWTEAWDFDPETKTLSGGSGLGVILAPRTVPYDEVEEIEIVAFHRGSFSGDEHARSMPGAQLRLILQLKNGPGITLNGADRRHEASLNRDAILLAESTGFKLKKLSQTELNR